VAGWEFASGSDPLPRRVSSYSLVAHRGVRDGPYSTTTMPQGILPTGTVATTLCATVSMTDT